jgi:hypothetical protein
MINAPLVLHLEVSAPFDLDGTDLKAHGLRIQREIKEPAANRRVFWVEPDTSTAGRIDGSIALIDKQGKVLSTISVNGEVRPHIRVSPARLFLGSVEYGTTSGKMVEKRFRLSTPGDWKVMTVDTSEIPGAEHELADLGSGAKELWLRFSEDTLKVGEPFGAFVTRTIRIQTDVAAQPQVDLVLTAMLSKNGTKRNFNTFVFKGYERWQGRWATPNIAGAVLGPIALMTIGYAVWLWGMSAQRLIFARGAAVILFLVGSVAMVLLVKTYSRGGWLSFAIGLIAMFFLIKQHRQCIAIAAGVFVLLVALCPAAAQRVASAGAVESDASIGNRLLVWRGTLEMIADHPVSGVGIGRFGEVFQNFYQEPWHKASYSTAINDYLTFAAERGLVMVLSIFAPATFLAASAVQLLKKHENEGIAPVLCTLLAICISSLFSSVESVREIRILTFSSTSLLFANVIWRFSLVSRNRLPSSSGSHPRIVFRSAIAAGAVVGLAAGLVWWANGTRIVRHRTAMIKDTQEREVRSISYEPSSSDSRGTVLFLPDEGSSLEMTGRNVLRPIAQSGWTAVSFTLPPYDQQARALVEEVMRVSRKPLIVLAEKSKARLVAVAVQNTLEGSQLRLGLVAPNLFSALAECDKSRAMTDEALHLASIDVFKWKAFKSGSRLHTSELMTCLQGLPTMADLGRKGAPPYP